MKHGKILVIDDNTDILLALRILLKQHFEMVHTRSNPELIPELMEQTEYDVILLDMNFKQDAEGGKEGFSHLKKILSIDPTATVIFITAYSDINSAVKAIKEGAFDFITKPWQNEKLITTISSAIKFKATKREVTKLRTKEIGFKQIINKPFDNFIGNSAAMTEVFNTIKKVAQTDASILILGENGTGKELVARAIHESSLRKDEVFIGVDLGAITETLFESEMFGHMKGAYTDAKGERPGRFEIASGGTLFLDEIGNLPLSLQAKLLRILETSEVTRLGSNKPKQIDIRLICATNMPLKKMINEGNYREDLIYRINTVEIQIPPLRDRIDDIPELADYFLKKFIRKYKKNIKGLSSASIKKMQKYSWPGNVRELRHAIERALIMSDSEILQPEDFIFSSHKSNADSFDLDNYNLDDIEKKVIQKVLRFSGGNISNAAKELGLTRTSLYRRMEKFGL